MRQIVMRHPGEVELVEVDPIRPSPADYLVEVEAAAVCSLDARCFLGARTRLDLGVPAILGHEVCGRVVQSPATSPLRGTRVAVIGTLFCRTCRACVYGRFIECENLKISANGYSELLLVPAQWCDWRLVPLAEDVVPRAGAFTDSLSCILRALRLADLPAGSRLAVCGGGFMACLLAVAARAWKDLHVVMISDGDLGDSVLHEYGIERYAWDQLARNDDLLRPGFAAIVDLSGRKEFATLCERGLAHGGRIVLMTGHGNAVLPPAATVYKQRASILTSCHCDLDDRALAAQLIGVFQKAILSMSVEFPLAAAGEALRAVASQQVLRGTLQFSR
jgi:threonine dehydrogenase-like Zn-dependent dehydrogenase